MSFIYAKIIEEGIPITIAIKKEKTFRKKLTWNVQNLHEKNVKILLKDLWTSSNGQTSLVLE